MRNVFCLGKKTPIQVYLKLILFKILLILFFKSLPLLDPCLCIAANNSTDNN